MPDKLTELKKYFGHSSFREGQETTVDALLSGHDTLAVMSTGAGKSVCYQLPAMLLRGTAIVISPLISLMKDQVTALREAGISAACLNSSLSPKEAQEVYELLSHGLLKLLYIAPERLDAPSFTSLMPYLEISLIAVDEAHCVSQWGQDFRPHYLKIADFIASLPKRPPIGAFTATATSQVRDDIVKILDLHSPVITVTGFDRPNLRFEVIRTKSKASELLKLLKSRSSLSGIVYCSTRKAVDEVWELLNSSGFDAARYHAGMEDDERRANQEDFVYDRKNIMVATNAFGMGIDKPDVRFVIHFNMPKDPESYYQEAGRAGRDGSPSDCILMYSARDVVTARYLIEHTDQTELSPDQQAEKLKKDFYRLSVMESYCATSKCLRSFLLGYFGETAPSYCGKCSNCEGDFIETDVTQDARKILSCIIKTGQRYGQRTVCDVLQGKPAAVKKGLERQSTFGIMENRSKDYIYSICAALKEKGYIFSEGGSLPIIKANRACIPLLEGKESLMIKEPKPKTPELPDIYAPGASRLPRRHMTPEEARELSLKKMGQKLEERRGEIEELESELPTQDLLTELKELRTAISKREGVPPYVVFSDFSLLDMCRKLPENREEFLEVSGVGNLKSEKYGEAFLAVIAKYISPDMPKEKFDMPLNYVKKRKATFEPDMSKIENFEFSDDPIPVSEISSRLDGIAIEGSKSLPAGAITYLLLENGLLTEEETASGVRKLPTELGAELGITTKWTAARTGVPYMILLYGRNAQEFIVGAAQELARIAATKPAPWIRKNRVGR